MNVTPAVSRAQLSAYTPPPAREAPADYSYQDRLSATSGQDLAEIRTAGFERLDSLGKRTALAGVGSAVTRGASFGIGIVALVRLMAAAGGTGALGPALVTGAVAGGLYAGHKVLDSVERGLKHDSRLQVQFLQDLDAAQQAITGVPADPWVFL